LGKRIWLTTALDEGRSLRAMCIDRATGLVLHDVEVFAPSEPGPINAKNSHASPTPVLEDDLVYVHFGAHGTACLSSDGGIVWKSDPWPYNHRHGPAGSPVLYDDLLIFSCDGTDVQFVVALDKQTGEVRWQTDRQGPMAYCTPQVIRVDGVDQLFSPGGDQAISYDPGSGEELWRFRYTGYSVVPCPVYGHGLVFFSSGYNDPVLYAIRADGRGDVTDTHMAWEQARGAPNTPSPLLVGDELYIVSDNGVATCLDARAGGEHWKQRIGGNYSASPLLADGRIYVLSEEGTTTVIASGKTYAELAKNQLDGQTLASLAVAGQSIYLRSETHLYRIEKPSQSAAQHQRPAASFVGVVQP
jgi:outer membrane protein assembly factor BamB